MPEIWVTNNCRFEYEGVSHNQNKITGHICHGLVRIKLPPASSDRRKAWIKVFFQHNWRIIKKWLENYQNHEKFHLDSSDRAPFIFLWGQRYFLRFSSKISEIDQSWPGITLNSKFKPVWIKPDLASIELAKRRIYYLLIQKYQHWFISRVESWAQKLNIKNTNALKVEIKLFKAHWGKFCNQSGKKVIRLNIWLIHFLPATIDYVIIHELVHAAFPHLNHGLYRYQVPAVVKNQCKDCQNKRQNSHNSPFWSQVEKYCPDFGLHIHHLNHEAGVG